ncbi:hypothetical protein P691DRAFT_765587 [Macrolepiota fuliginosa MF-IS2]|uniref:Uncharacterized protein n=1 Tax=Macrolepiota fuliginosa MF-IS2 TaxID=1400762 RepID=A0A9P5X2C3_9AGAR|nr:hypothetical protein P691DRAFT_765587 [Macrolepiota fuliginosa MF-IS2]
MLFSPNDLLSPLVPQLELSGANWVEFAMQFHNVMCGKFLWGHFDGTDIQPVCSIPSSMDTDSSASSSGTATPTSILSASSTTAAARTPAPSSRTSADSSHTPSYILGTDGKILDWDHYKSLACLLLMTQLPTSTAFIVDELSSVQDMWNAVVSEYTYKGAFSQTCLRHDFLSLRCPKNGDVQQFLAHLCSCHTELNSLPWALANFASMQLLATTLYPSLSGGTIEPNHLINMICDEWEWIRSHQHKGRGKDNTLTDDAMGVEAGGPGKGKGKGRGKPKGPCYNCNGPHWKCECPELKKKGGERPTPGPSKPAAGANMVVDDDVSFAVEVIEIDDEDLDEDLNWQIPGAISMDVMDSLEDWFGVDDGDLEEECEECSYISESEEIIVGQAQECTSEPRIEIFDSGSSWHISPYRDAFSTFKNTPPHPL